VSFGGHDLVELAAEFKRENEAKTPSLPAPETAGE
jgi:hypothetical protein